MSIISDAARSGATVKPDTFVPARRSLRRVPAAAPERLITWDERPFRFLFEDGEDHVPVWIDVLKLDAMLSLAAHMEYVGFAGKGGIFGKYDGIDKVVRRRKRLVLEMARVKIEPAVEKHPDQEVVYICDGRHRFAWMRDHGARALPVAALASEASGVAELVGSKDRVCRVILRKIPEWHW